MEINTRHVGSGFADITQDARLYDALAADMLRRLTHTGLPGGLSDSVLRHQAAMLEREIVKARERLSELLAMCSRGGDSRGLESAVEKKLVSYRILRVLSGLVGAVVTGDHWQSPSFADTGEGNVAPTQGKITAHLNDYTRDQHSAGKAYEQAFIRQFVHHLPTVPVYGFATASGMAAVSVAAHFALATVPRAAAVLVGTQSYFENLGIIDTLFGDCVIRVDESDTQAVVAAIKKHKPAAMFLDTMTNSPDIVVPDMARIYAAFAKVPGRRCLVVDRTCTPLSYQPLALSPSMPRGMTLIVAESLNKYHQYGFDRVTGGFVWGTGSESIVLYDHRDRLGANITESNVSSLPTPDRPLLSGYLARLTRNASMLAGMLDGALTGFDVVHPSLCGRKVAFSGSYLMLRPSVPCRFEKLERLVSMLFARAKKQNVQLVGGTSFGLPVTRVYAIGPRGPFAKTPYIRVSVGTETETEMDAIAKVFINAVRV